MGLAGAGDFLVIIYWEYIRTNSKKFLVTHSKEFHVTYSYYFLVTHSEEFLITLSKEFLVIISREFLWRIVRENLDQILGNSREFTEKSFEPIPGMNKHGLGRGWRFSCDYFPGIYRNHF